MPYRHRPVTPTYPSPAWTTWLVEDQRFVEHRPDVLSWETEPLTNSHGHGRHRGRPVRSDQRQRQRLGGEADRCLSRGLPEDDGDRKIEKDAGPVLNGYELMIADDILRGRYRNSLETPEADHAQQGDGVQDRPASQRSCFLKGHRIMVQVQSTWFPLYDRNPQKFVRQHLQGNRCGLHQGHTEIYRSKDAASSVILPVANN